MPERARPSEMEIRWALAQCMTVEDIDDAMGWPRGTARRRRWMAPQRGGLPFADAELGGVALWFRSTFEAWRDSTPARAGSRRRRRDDTAGDDRAGAQAEVRSEAVLSPADPGPAGPDVASDADDATGPDDAATDGQGSAQPVGEAERTEAQEGDPAAGVEPSAPSAPDRRVRELDGDPEPDDQPDDDEPVQDGDAPEVLDRPEPGDGAVGSGFELEIGQQVLAEVQGRWRAARVSSRDRNSVLVTYQIDDTPLGARVQRIEVGRVRTLHPESELPD